ncbi:NUDIX domain-containing protein [Microbispora bryophytorum]|uniref:NUDIX domain-containing protein n=1 Tax=Microbispora bryophytorum TaxID=1460882 RepID=UPI0014306219|nr:NUDIX domain-containing protein [Microbispora bryophytorum]MBD3136400.1 NUDIX domain-containing protein [Microbispora bryophytorum]
MCHGPPRRNVEAGQSPVSALLRELREELGIAPPVGRLACVDPAPPSSLTSILRC